MHAPSKIVLIARVLCDFGNLSIKPPGKRESPVDAPMRYINGKNTGCNDLQLDWANSDQKNLRIVEISVTQNKRFHLAKALLLSERYKRTTMIINKAVIDGSEIQDASAVNDHPSRVASNFFALQKTRNAFCASAKGHAVQKWEDEGPTKSSTTQMPTIINK